MNTTTTEKAKSIKLRLADPETYLETIAECMSEEQKENLQPHHVANVMALAAELMLTYAGPIGRSFVDQGELDVTLKAKLGSVKDTVQIQFKRAAELKDSASAEVPDPDQAQMDFSEDKPEDSEDEAAEAAPVKALPKPEMETLPEPEDNDVIEAEIVEEGGEEGE